MTPVNFKRDVHHVDWNAQSLSTTTTYSVNPPYVRSDGVVYSDRASIRIRENFTFPAIDSWHWAGVLLNGPGDADDRTVYRVRGFASLLHVNGTVYFGFGAGPATPSSAAGGQVMNEEVIYSEMKENIVIDETIAVADFVSNPGRSIMFGFGFSHVAASAQKCVGSLSVQRLVAAQPALAVNVP
jgi:hypothetical protein